MVEIDKSIQHKLIELSKIFKEGFTISVKNGIIDQYNDTNKPYILSYQTLIEIHDKTTTFKNGIIPNNCIIGGWRDHDTNIYYIELNKTYANKNYALKIAKKYNQKAIYDSLKRVVINV